jgi:asparagine synthase (glutamine-hydrolysing)
MSVQFGRWNFDGVPPNPDYISKVSATLAPYGTDSSESYSKGGITILYRAFCTTPESHREIQPYVSLSGTVITWDGRLDNRADLVGELRHFLTIKSTDVVIVAAAFERWGIACCAKLIGDWALSIWNPLERSLLLAKDPIGTRHLYYSLEKDHIIWSTTLDPLVRHAGKTFVLNEEYVAGWLSYFPLAHLTPYSGIHAVPPSSSVLVRPDRHRVKHIISKYWDFDPSKKIRYNTDAEYEEHFRSVLASAVQRRLRSDRPILSELSGGLDSSSIVCMADTLIAGGQVECPRLDTITWYDVSKPNWGELHHVTKVEEKRGRVGHHIDTSSVDEDDSPPFGTEFVPSQFAATPVPNNRTSEFFRQNAAYIRTQGYRVTISGIGGGEATGDGVPTPTPELQNLLSRAQFLTLAHRLKAWAARMGEHQLRLLWQAAQRFLVAPIDDVPKALQLVSWFHPGFVRRNRASLHNRSARVKLFGPLPSLQDHIDKLDKNRRFLAFCSLNSELLREVRYPYFDRTLLEFVYAIPCDQIVRVGQRRSLMKRALVGIVPNEVLNRRKRVSREQPTKVHKSPEWPSLAEIGQRMLAGSLGIIDQERFLQALEKARWSEEVLIGALRHTLTLECWLRQLAICGVLTISQSTTRNDSVLFQSKELRAPTQFKSSVI